MKTLASVKTILSFKFREEKDMLEFISITASNLSTFQKEYLPDLECTVMVVTLIEPSLLDPKFLKFLSWPKS